MTDVPAEPATRRRPPPPIPLTVLTGFLGAGKTRLLNALLRDPDLAETAVIINEFGDIALDHLLVEYVEDGVVMIGSGCLCCTMRGDLVDVLEKLLRDRDNGRIAFRRVVIETTGLADPAPVLHTAMVHPYLTLRFRLDGVVTVVDAINGLATLESHEEAVKQVAVADRLVLTKTDLLDSEEHRAAAERLRARLRQLNPAAPLLDAAAGEAVAARLLDCGLFDPERKIPDVKRWLAAEAYDSANAAATHPHDDRIRSFSIASEAALPGSALDMFLDLVRSAYGDKLLRLKGVIRLAEMPERPLVVHGVQHVFHPPAALDAWPDDDHRTRLVVIARDVEPQAIQALFDAFTGAVSADRPDAAALADNPLVPFGGRDR
jgi:G3E family GTPase